MLLLLLKLVTVAFIRLLLWLFLEGIGSATTDFEASIIDGLLDYSLTHEKFMLQTLCARRTITRIPHDHAADQVKSSSVSGRDDFLQACDNLLTVRFD